MDAKALHFNGLVSLPIIISDYDTETASPVQSPTKPSNSHSEPPSPTSPAAQFAAQQHWKTGFSEFAEDLVARMSGGMKQKLRDACVEVLKRTEEGSSDQSGDRMAWQFDEDARFLD